MKTCRACGIEKPIEEFHKASKTPDGRQYRCKECAISAARQRALDNPEAKREADRRYRQTDRYRERRAARRAAQRDTINEQKRASYYRHHDENLEKLRNRQADPEFRRKARERYALWRERHPRAAYASTLRRFYDTTLEQFDAMVLAQEGRCAICDRSTPDLVVDHCHAQGHVRALLCPACNSALGLFQDNPAVLRKAAEYVLGHVRPT